MGSLGDIVDLVDEAVLDLTVEAKTPPISRPSSPAGSLVGTMVPLVPGSGLSEGGVSAVGGTSGLGDGVGAYQDE
eukprot:1203111-Amphidinium_carterae.1